jgi:hypothetical protein
MSAYLLACLAFLPHADAAKPKWGTDLAAASKRAKEFQRPLFVVFRCDH